jgi:hypothetical protein
MLGVGNRGEAERMCPLPQQIPIAETSKASTGCPVQDKINRMGAGGM